MTTIPDPNPAPDDDNDDITDDSVDASPTETTMTTNEPTIPGKIAPRSIADSGSLKK